MRIVPVLLLSVACLHQEPDSAQVLAQQKSQRDEGRNRRQRIQAEQDEAARAEHRRYEEQKAKEDADRRAAEQAEREREKAEHEERRAQERQKLADVERERTRERMLALGVAGREKRLRDCLAPNASSDGCEQHITDASLVASEDELAKLNAIHAEDRAARDKFGPPRVKCSDGHVSACSCNVNSSDCCFGHGSRKGCVHK